MASAEGQQHPLSVYFWIWGLLFVLSFFSYMVDYLNLQGNLRWGLILLFMFLKAGFIVAIFMHMKWERLSLKFAIMGPPVAILVLIALMALEGDYVETNRIDNYGESTFEPQALPHH
jgi:caa(3)-type oxidase subunit IV